MDYYKMITLWRKTSPLLLIAISIRLYFVSKERDGYKDGLNQFVGEYNRLQMQQVGVEIRPIMNGMRTDLEQHVHEHCKTHNAYCVAGSARGVTCYCDGEESTFMPNIMSLTRKDTWVLDCRINNRTRGGTQSDCKQLEEVYENAKKKGKQQHAKKKDGRNWIMTDIV